MKARWDPVIADYSKVIELATGQALPSAGSSSPSTEEEEWSLAIASYNKAMEMSKDPALVQKAKDAIKLIEEIRQDINR
jgi:hypothetical protein